MSALKTVRLAAWAAVALMAAAGVTIFVMDQVDEAPVVVSIGGPFTLTDQNGRTVTEASLAGHPSAMFFGYTFCPDVCPTTLFEMTDRMDRLGADADGLKIYFVTVDPERDTQAVLAEYLQAFDPRIVGLTGSREEVDRMLRGYRVFSRKIEREGGPYLMEHTSAIYLFDRTAAFTGTISYQEDEDAALAKLRRLIEGA